MLKKSLSLIYVLLFAISGAVSAQPGGGPQGSARDNAPVDFTGYWVSVVNEDWRFRMVVPDAGAFMGLPLNAEGRRVGNTWDPQVDSASGLTCLGFGAPAIMRLPGRFNISWEDDNTLKIETDFGNQTRLLHFNNSAPGAPSLQGYSTAEWQMAPRNSGGGLKVVTRNLTAGYIRRNGAPYSSETTVTEYYDLHAMPNGDSWISITSIVEDPIYFSGPFIKTTDLKKLSGNEGWDPVECSVQ